MELAPSGKRSSRLASPDQERHHGVGKWKDAIQCGSSGAKPAEAYTAGIPPEPSTKPDSIGASGSSGLINILALNVRGIMCHTSHSAYVATETELDGAKIDGLLPPNFL